MQSAITSAKSPPPPVPNESKPAFSSHPAAAPPIPSGSKPKGMQLSSYKAPSFGVLPGGLTEEARWDGDLMDVNADADDWSTYPTPRLEITNKHTNQSLYLDAFESAPTPNVVGTVWGGTTAGDDEDPWGAFEDPTPPPVPIPVTELTSSSPPTVTAARTSSARPARVAALTPSSSPRASPLASPAMSEGTALPIPASPVPGKVAGMTKEEKAAEMARRKEERKQVRLCVPLFLCRD